MKVQRDGRNVTVEVTADGEGLVSHAGSTLLATHRSRSLGLAGGLAGDRAPGAPPPRRPAFHDGHRFQAILTDQTDPRHRRP